MTITVRYFGPVREMFAVDAEELEVPEGTTVADLRKMLSSRPTRFSDLSGAIRFAINLEYALEGDEIPAGGEVAVIPPVAGG